MSYSYLIQGSNIVVVIDSKVHTINKSHLSYSAVKEAIKASDWDTLKEIIDPRKAVKHFGQGYITLEDDVLFWKNEPMHSTLATRILDMAREGFDINPMVKFMENLMSNPSPVAIAEAYEFLEACNLPITPDGHFLAFKKVRDNYLDVHSGTMDNSVGETLSMNRADVDDNRHRTCSDGLHFCSQSYLDNFGGTRTMILKINPRDIVSIPIDHKLAKGRCCAYTVIGELTVEPVQAFTKSVQVNANGCETPENDIIADEPTLAEISVAQEYDAKGNPLSMTKNAIYKRAKRAAAKTV
jgi:hypothetical protein